MSEESRWSYTRGSRPEGVIVYDGASKIHSHHDTDIARGQHNSWDLVRLHLFGELDKGASDNTLVMELPSSKAMMKFAAEQPELRNAQAREEMEDLGPLPEPNAVLSIEEGAGSLARRVCDVLRNPTIPRWLLTDILEHGVIALMAGPRGSFKSFIALDWTCRIAQAGHCVYVISAEGGDFDRRVKAWIRVFNKGDDSLPIFVVERRLDLSTVEGIQAIRNDCQRLAIEPKLFVLDTFSKLSGGMDENSNTDVKAFIGRLDNGLKRAETGFDATVLLVAHTGHSDAGRPRGASALAADTDAEYIVARQPEGSVLVTRERFKSSPELGPLALKPDIVNLGYHDADGNAITSLVLHPIDAPTFKKQRNEPRTQVQRMLLNDVKNELKGGAKAFMEVVRALASRLPTGEGRDQRTQRMQRAVSALVEGGFIHNRDNVLSIAELPNAVSVSSDEFDILPERTL